MDTITLLLKYLFYIGFLLHLFTKGAGAVNDLCACAEADQYNIVQLSNVMENEPINSVIQKFTFTGGSRIRVESAVSNPFVVFDVSTYELKVLKNIEVRQHNPLLLNGIKLICTILENGQKIEYQVFIEVQDANNHSPIFANQPYVFNVSELTPAGLSLTPEILANDLDPRDVGHLTYSIVNDNAYSEYFNFTIPSKGRLILQKQINYQDVNQIVLRIEVKDNSYNYSIFGTYQPQHKATTTATINILPILADMPTFVNQSYTLDLEEDYDKAREITIDPSWGVHVKEGYTFSLVKDPNLVDWQQFSIERSRGTLKLKGGLNRSQYLLQLHVRKDSKSLFSTTLVVIRRILKVTFAHRTYNTTLHPSTPLGSQVVLLKLTTNSIQCEGSSYGFKIEDSDKNDNYFRITNEGRVLLTKHLDSSLPKRFKMKILLYYNSKFLDTAELNIEISNDILATFKFSQDIYEFHYYNDSYIGRVQIISQFSESLIIYNLVSKNKDLTIDFKGVIRCIKAHCWSSGYPILVTAQANNSVRSSALVVLNSKNLQKFSGYQDGSVDYKTAFVVAMILACLLLCVILAFVIFLCLLYKRKSEQFEDHFNNISTTFSEESSDPFAHNSRKLSKLDKIQGILVNGASDLGTRNEQKTESNEITEAEASNKEANKVYPTSITDLKKGIPQRELPSQNISDLSILSRTDVNTSQDTINASIMTLTRPAVGTNGITVYY